LSRETTETTKGRSATKFTSGRGTGKLLVTENEKKAKKQQKKKKKKYTEKAKNTKVAGLQLY